MSSCLYPWFASQSAASVFQGCCLTLPQFEFAFIRNLGLESAQAKRVSMPGQLTARLVTMRDFNEKDKKKKRERIALPDNPANLPAEKLSELESTVSSSLRDGYMPCPLAWKIAREADVPRIAVGAVIDKMGRRVTDCQIGCFKIEKIGLRTAEKIANRELVNFYELAHEYYIEDEDVDYITYFGIYTTEEEAEAEKIKLCNKGVYKKYPDNFTISEIKVDRDLGWIEGFNS